MTIEICALHFSQRNL